MTTPAGKTPLQPGSLPIAPTADEWRAMSSDERERLLVEILDALSDPQSTMAEGRRHKKAKGQIIDTLGLHFGEIGRTIYLAEEMAVLYPGEPVFSPDILAVVGVEQPEDDPRMAWVVADEGKGLDLALEVLHHGDRKKDLVENVERYARLGIPEYFVYDRLHQQIYGYRLPATGPGRYQRIMPQLGRYHSAVLDLDLMIVGGRLRFYYGMGELIGSPDLIGRLQTMVEEQAAKAEQAQSQAEQALSGARATLLAICEARRLPCPDEARARVESCDDLATLQRWILRAATVAALDEVFAS